MTKERLDVLVAKRGLAESREQAQRLILAGQVSVDGTVVCKAGHRYDESAAVAVAERARFVSRGGDKLEAAFLAFHLNVSGQVCLDVGSSTGGFTDCMLQHGASRVFAADVGRGQLHWKLRNDPRVVVLEGINARYLSPPDLPEPPGFAAADVSFISLTKILPAVKGVLRPGAGLVTLIKPQFEAGRRQVSRGGVVRDAAVRAQVVERVREFGTGELGLQWLGQCESPLKGPAGNVEILGYWRVGE